MSSEVRFSQLDQRADQLLEEIRKGAGQEDLAGRIRDLYDQVIRFIGEDQEEASLKHKVARLVVLNQIVIEGPLLPVPHDRVETILGSVNQYDLKQGNSSCTSCAQCFLARVLPKGTACSVLGDEIDVIVQDGYYNFDLLLTIKMKEAHAEGVSKALIVTQAMDTTECSEIYGLQILKAGGDEKERVLVKGEDGTTKEFFRQLLQECEGNIGRRNALGAVIHSDGKTFALALFQSPHGFEWALFDSHGYPDNKAPAYVKHTDSREKMVECLSELVEYKACDASDLPPGAKEKIESDDNGFVFYIVEHQDHQILAEPYEIPVPDANPVPERVGEEIVVEPEKEKIDEDLPLDAESSNIERRVALFLLILAVFGVSYRLRRQITRRITVIPST